MSPRGGGCVPLTDAQRAESEKYLKLCGYAANRFARKYRHVARGEFLSAAFEGLADAVKRFDESRGVAMECYAPHRIEGACREVVRRDTGGAIRVTRVGYAAGLAPGVISIDAAAIGSAGRGTSLGDFLLPPAKTPPPDAEMAARDGFEALLAGLGAVERFVLRKVYGPDGWNLRQVADHVGLSQSRVGQVHDAAMVRVAARAVRLGLSRGRAPVVKAPKPRRLKGGQSGHPTLVGEPVDPATARGALAAAVGVDPADLDGMLARLKPNQRRAVALRHGLDGVRRPMGEVAREMGCTRPGADYAHKAGLARLREMAGRSEQMEVRS